MDSLARAMAVIEGRLPDRIPVSLHNFLAVGQFIGCDDVGQMMKDAQLMAEAQIACHREIGHDIIQLENGVAALAEALGAEVRYSPTEPPHVVSPILGSLKDAEKLVLPDPKRGWPLCENLKCTSIVSRELGDRVFICGRADQGPMALALELRGVENLLYDVMDATEDPEKERQLLSFLEFCAECSIVYGLAQGRAGAHGTCIGGCGVSVISPSLYVKYEMPLEIRYVQTIKSAGMVPFLHICGDEAPILQYIIDTGAQVLELDPLTEMHTAKRLASGKTTLLGFVDAAHVMGRGTPSLVKRKCREAIEALSKNGGFILSPGCALPIETPADNMQAMMEAATEYGQT